MAAPIHLWPEPVHSADGLLTYRARVEDAAPFTLWYRLADHHLPLLTSRAESFVAATILHAIRRGENLRVHAPLSPCFLRQLEEFQTIWACWDATLRRITVEPDGENESAYRAPERALTMFSGGVDSCYTLWRHVRKECGRRTLPVKTALMIQGSEIGLDRPEMFQRALQRTRGLLAAVPVDLLTLSTNFREVIRQDYAQRTFGTLMASCLLLFQEAYTTGLIPASFSYHGLVLPYGSTPLTDPLLGTGRFTIEHDGAGASRAEKLREILPWPRLLDHLRVCNLVETADVNCGRCEKCVRNILTLRLLGVTQPRCFPHDPTDAEIQSLYLEPAALEAMRRVLVAARAAGVQESWTAAAETAIRRNERRLRWHELRQRIGRRMPRVLESGWQALEHRLLNTVS